MAIVEARDLRRAFTVYDHRPGLWGALANLFSTKGRVVEAVAGLDLTVDAGEFVGIVGPNGAGKSTSLKMLTGILVPTSGALSVCGCVPHTSRAALAARIGVVFGQRTQLWWDLPASEGFRLLRHIYAVDPQTHARRLAELTERLELAAFVDTPVRKLSLGQKMRCELVAALLHGPEILFLDEPTIGLDVVVKEALHRFLRELNEEGTTVLLTSHDLDDIERLCRRVVVIDQGAVLHDGDLPSLHARYRLPRRLVLQLAEPLVGPMTLPEGATVLEGEGRRHVVSFDPITLPAPRLLRAVLEAHDVVDLSVQEASIEEVVKRMYRGG